MQLYPIKEHNYYDFAHATSLTNNFLAILPAYVCAFCIAA